MLMSTVKDTDTHHREQVVRSIRVVVDTAEERCGGVFANVLDEEMATAGMLFEEGGDVVDESGDDDERAFDTLLLV